MKKVWFITGSSKGLGKNLVEALLLKGDYVVATARNPEQLKEFVDQYPEQLLTLELDVQNKEQIYSAVEEAVNILVK